MPNENYRNARMQQQLRQRQTQTVTQAQMRKNQGLVQNTGAVSLKANIDKSLAPNMRPGNVGAINRVFWPFWFTFTAPELTPSSSSTGFTTITQEAAFVWMAYSKAIYKKSAGPVYTYVDPNDETAAGAVDGLKFTLKDASSSRVFHNSPLEIDCVGNPEFPSVLPTPIMFLPNATIEISYTNDNSTETFVPFMTFFGYRVRIEDAQSLLGTVVG